MKRKVSMIVPAVLFVFAIALVLSPAFVLADGWKYHGHDGWKHHKP